MDEIHLTPEEVTKMITTALISQGRIPSTVKQVEFSQESDRFIVQYEE